MMGNLFMVSTLIVSTLLIIHASVSLWQMLFAWNHPDQIERNELPKKNSRASTRFSLVIPALYEAKVIKETLDQLSRQTYHKHFYEIIVVLYKRDTATKKQVRLAKSQHSSTHIRTLVYNHRPKGKSQSLNYALSRVTGDYVIVFDAEDHIHPMFLSVMNTFIRTRGRKVYQTGVSLMNFTSRWFTFHNVLEYYFWFLSRLPWYAARQFVPLGGTGVLFPIEVLKNIGGWDESCLTEDAKIGVDISAAGYSFDVFSNEQFDTREEAPDSLKSFISQRTRWIQGFLQIVSSESWRRLSLKKQFYFFSFFLFPLAKFFLTIWLLFSLLLIPKLPVIVVLFSFIPLSLLAFQIIVQVVAIYEMLDSRGERKLYPWAVVLFFLSYLPYELLMNYCAVRAVYRFLRKNTAWEKTMHRNLNGYRLFYQSYSLQT